MSGSEIEYYVRRAGEEARRARDGRVPEAAAVHGTLAILYSARAFMLRVAEHKPLPESDDRPSLTGT